MFNPSNPFSLMDLDMWDTKSSFSTQSSALWGMAAGSGFLSGINNSAGGFGQKEAGMRRWQSMSHLVPDRVAGSFPPSGFGLRPPRDERGFRQAEVMRWLRDAHERVDSHLNRLNTRDMQLDINASQLLDRKHKQLSESSRVLEKERKVTELPGFQKSQQHRELHEKVLKLEKDMFQMTADLDKSVNHQPMERAAGLNNKPKQKAETELLRLKEALIEAETKAKTQEQERNNAVQHLQTSTETQRSLQNQMEEVNKRLSQTVQNHKEVQEQLTDANNKISQACLEKATLSTQVLKLEDNVKELKDKLAEALSDKDRLVQEKAELLQKAEVLESQLEKTQHSLNVANRESSDFTEGEKQREELEMIRKNLELSQSQLQELKEEKIEHMKQIADLESQRSKLIEDKDELMSKMNESPHQKEKCCQHRESVESLESENQKLRDECLVLQAEVSEKGKMLHLQEEDYRKQDSQRVQAIEELKAMTAHWTQKWQNVALTLQSTQEELEEVKKKNNSRQEKHSESALQMELDACKRALELERRKNQAMFLRVSNKGGEAVQTEDKHTGGNSCESSLVGKPATDHNKSSQRPEDGQDGGNLPADFSTIDSLRIQLEESRRRADQLQLEKMMAVQKLQTLRRLYQVKDEEPSVEDKKEKTVSPPHLETEQQRRMVTEQLKTLFKEREEKEAVKAEGSSSAGKAEASSSQDWTSKPGRPAAERRSWHPISDLMPVFEEDEEDEDASTQEEEQGEKTQRKQMSPLSAELSNLKHESFQQALSFTPHLHNPHTAQKPSDKSSLCLEECGLKWKSTPLLYPDGIFMAELVEIGSDEDGEKG